MKGSVNMCTINIFCDASVGSKGIGSCAGALIEIIEKYKDNQDGKEYTSSSRQFNAVILHQGTNNSGEAAAVALGVSKAIEIYKRCMLKSKGQFTYRINIFSDSLITVKGIKEWIFGWIENYRDCYLINASNNIVANQYFFKYIYNMILLNPEIKINIYHQEGHVTSYFDSMMNGFRRVNGIYPQDIGLTPQYLCVNNDYVDNITRKIINEYISTGYDNGYPVDFTNYKNPTCNFNPPLLDTSSRAIEIYKNAIA